MPKLLTQEQGKELKAKIKYINQVRGVGKDEVYKIIDSMTEPELKYKAGDELWWDGIAGKIDHKLGGCGPQIVTVDYLSGGGLDYHIRLKDGETWFANESSLKPIEEEELPKGVASYNERAGQFKGAIMAHAHEALNNVDWLSIIAAFVDDTKPVDKPVEDDEAVNMPDEAWLGIDKKWDTKRIMFDDVEYYRSRRKGKR